MKKWEIWEKVRNFEKSEKFREKWEVSWKKSVEKSEKFWEILRKIINFVKSKKFREKMRKKPRNISRNFSMRTQKKSGEPLVDGLNVRNKWKAWPA
jgi:hypothetical protein